VAHHHEEALEVTMITCGRANDQEVVKDRQVERIAG
jgi:hypothetical protein